MSKSSKRIRPALLVVDDDISIGEFFKELFDSKYDITVVYDGESGLSTYGDLKPDVVMLDVRLPEMSGVEVLEKLMQGGGARPTVIMITANREVETAVTAMKLGAFDYILKPFNSNEELDLVVARALESSRVHSEVRELRREVKQFYSPDNIIGTSPAMQKIYKQIERVLDNDVTVLIRGESGTGKEMVARAIHYGGRRSGLAFVPINCAAIPENLLENELFGHEKGAFTGAVASRKGKFEQADGGSLFLDEICSLDYDLQAKLLRVLQEKVVERVGGSSPVSVDVRIISATSRNLEQMVADEKFRDDLFYRINVMSIEMPPLRDRVEDIPALVEHFIQKHAARLGAAHVLHASPAGLRRLMDHSWPGNVRELENTIERSLLYCDAAVLDEEHIQLSTPIARPSSTSAPAPGARSLDDAEKDAVLEALKKTGYNISKAADILGVTRKTLRAKMERYDIQKAGGGDE